MSLMTGETTKPFVNTDCSAIVPGARLSIGERRMALITESLANVRAELDISIAHAHCGQWKMSERHVVEFSPVE